MSRRVRLEYPYGKFNKDYTATGVNSSVRKKVEIPREKGDDHTVQRPHNFQLCYFCPFLKVWREATAY